ncbi:MAG: MBL fold metallo-hydrolase [Hahellaceae bacterium]|nr:MBL fold metallo-hydrolase [Hahellaceae bacterium]
MRLCIHRAASNIGGNCIELEASGESILLDLGLPLGVDRASISLLPSVPGISQGETENLLAVILSHPHQDHYGLLSCANHKLPVYLGTGAKRLLEAATFFTESAKITQQCISYDAFHSFQVGPFKITPYPVDHSAYDAYSLLIEADGKRVFYSGDFRMHGRKQGLMESMLRSPPKNIDVLLMEGTIIGREDAESNTTESELESKIVVSLNQLTGLALACFSPQNIDRLVTFYKAALRSGRILVVDAYTAHILNMLEVDSLSSILKSDRIRIFLPSRQKLQIVRAGRFDLIEPYRGKRVYESDFCEKPGRWVCLFRSSMSKDFEEMDCLRGATLIYSLWPGYLKRDEGELHKWCANNGVCIEVQHTSGHAYLADLIRFSKSISPKSLIPIHTNYPELFIKYFEDVQVVDDSTWVDI